MQATQFRVAAGVWVAVALVLLAGSRHLLTRGVPAVGELVAFGTGPVDLLREWAGGWRSAGLGSGSPNPTLWGATGLLGFTTAGAMGLLRTVLTVGLLPLGAFSAYRLAGPIGSRYAQVAALIVYVSVPVPYNALENGRWGVLALYAAAPAVLSLLARASGLAPFGTVDGSAGPRLRPRTRRQITLVLGVTTALVAMVLPVAVLIVPAMAAALALGSMLAYRARGTPGFVGAGFGAAAIAFALHLPWSLDLVLPGTTWTSLTGPEGPARAVELHDLLRFQLGTLGGPPLGWAFLVAAALPLLIGTAERHAWAVRGWTLAVASWGLAWLSARGDLPFPLPPPEVLVVPAAAGLALATAMGVAAFQADLPGYRFGWRQVASGLAAAGVALGTLPALAAAVDGRWSMPAGDHNRALGFIEAEADESDFRVLWLGDPAVLPLGSWDLGGGLAYATTDRGTPGLQDLLVGSDDGRTGLLADAVDLARRGETARLGRLLAPMGVRYVVLAERLAPAPFAEEEHPAPASFKATLAGQLDLDPLDVPAGLTVYRNEAAMPVRAAVEGDGAVTTAGIAEVQSLDLSGATAVLTEEAGQMRWTGEVPSGSTVLVAAAHSDAWQLEVDGRRVPLEKAFGWSVGFQVDDGGDASLRLRTSPLRYGLVAAQVLGWLLVLRALLRVRLSTAGQHVRSEAEEHEIPIPELAEDDRSEVLW